MDRAHWEPENRVTMSSAAPPTSSHANSLPPLHQAIPEFHSHNPQERRSSSVPRKFVERGSPSFRAPPRLSPSSSSSLLDATPGEPTENSYDAQTYPFPGALDSRRGPPSHAIDPRPSAYLPPMSSLTTSASRGSSFDIENQDRSSSLPLLYNPHPHQQQQPSQPPPGYGVPPHDYETSRSHPTTPDYQRYPPAAASSSSSSNYSSINNHYSQSQNYAHSSPTYQPPRPQTSYSPLPTEARSPFSPPGHASDLSLDHFENRPGKRRRGNLPKQVTDLLRSWLSDHLHHPYPTEEEKQMLMAQTGLTIHQISNWFINARRRRLPAITNSDPKTSTSRRPSSGP